jgi:hypothetical protein
MFSTLQGVTRVLSIPGLGSVEIGPYRYIMLILGTIFFLSLLGLYRVEALLRERQARTEAP